MKKAGRPFYENEFKEAMQGSGPKVVEKAAELGARRVISGDFGPKAKELLFRLNLQMVILTDNSMTMQDIIHKIN